MKKKSFQILFWQKSYTTKKNPFNLKVVAKTFVLCVFKKKQGNDFGTLCKGFYYRLRDLSTFW